METSNPASTLLVQDPLYLSCLDGTPASLVRVPTRIALVADDNSVDALVMMRLLQNSRFQVHSVENGQAALNEASDQHYDLILLDLSMPVLNGKEVVYLLRQREKYWGIRTPIVGVTANRSGAEAQSFIQSDLDGFLEKPITKKSFQRLLESPNLFHL